MSTTLQFRRGNSAAAAAVTGANGEIYINTQTKTIHVHDGTTVGGFALANASSLAGKANVFVNVVENGSNVVVGNTTTGCSYVTMQGTYLNLDSNSTLVNGNIFLGSGVYANGSSGNAGQVLMTNGTSTYWSNVATSSANLQSVAADVLPSFSGVYDLGSSSKQWNDIFLNGYVNINGVTMTGTITGTAGSAEVVTTTNYSNTYSIANSNYTNAAWGFNFSQQYTTALPTNVELVAFTSLTPAARTVLQSLPVGASITIRAGGVNYTTTATSGLLSANFGTEVIGINPSGIPMYLSGIQITSVSFSYSTTTVVSPAVPDTRVWSLTTNATFTSQSLVVNDALVGSLLFTNNMVTPTGAASQYSGNTTGTLIINGNATVTGNSSVTGNLTVGGSAAIAGQLSFTPATLAAVGNVAIDFTGAAIRTQGPLTGDVTYTSNSYVAGGSVTVRVTGANTTCNVAFPTGWVFVGTKPTTLASGKVAVLTVTSFGTTANDCVAAWAVQA